ncbi:hypothetical protein OQA88_2728 [Cercophora sp. LCS_1]
MSSGGSDDYYLMHIARSDGKGYTSLDHNPLNPKEDKDIEQLERWEVIIAGHLQNQLLPKTEKRQFKLASFPRGYELRCAVRKDGGRDYYLYGHPAGPKSNYRTPGDFVLHAMWLLSESKDYGQCSCDLCARFIEASKLRQPVSQGAESTPANAPVNAAAAQVPPAAASPAGQPQSTAARGQLAVAPGPSQVMALSPSFPGTTGPANIFRVGELVWYKQVAWRLGLVMDTQFKTGSAQQGDANFTFVLAPLGHAVLGQQTIPKDAGDMRPFHTFSVPGVTDPELKDKSFEEIDWRNMGARHAQEENAQLRNQKLQILGLEASKMAARAIDATFSTFNKLKEAMTQDGSYKFEFFKGVYLGAEMVWIGDPLRVSLQGIRPENHPDAPGSSSGVMRVSEIQLLTPNWQGSEAPAPALQFKGPVYRIAHAPATGPSRPASFADASKLGSAFEQEVSIRNKFDRNKDKRVWGWELITNECTRTEAQVQGRCYVTYKLLSIIEPLKLREALNNGEIMEADKHLNSRAQAGWGLRPGLRQNRAAAIGEAIATKFIAPAGIVES